MTGETKSVKNTKADSCAFFKPLWQLFKILGITLDVDDSQRLLYTFYAAFINILATILYPLHLSLMLFRSETMAENIKNLAVSVTCVACSVKFIIYSTKLPMLRTFEGLLRQLDRRISEGEQLDYFRQLRRLLRYIAFTFLGIYSLIGITATLSFVFSEERRLLYPAYFPFNWMESTPKYLMANLYQSSVICILLSQNYVDDCFPAMALCVLSGHISILSMRVANIGHANTSREENEEEMIKCVKDQKRLYELYLNIQDIISPAMFIQFGVTAINTCVAIVALLFYVSAPFDIVYYFAYFLAMPMEIFPSCYYGSDVQYRFSQLHRSAFWSNWIDQSPKFKKHMILFTERSLKVHEVKAGGMLRVHLDTFFSTCKGAYSMFAVITRMK